MKLTDFFPTLTALRTRTYAQWVAVRNTPRNLWRRRGRPFWPWAQGTYVRQRHDPAEDIRLAAYQGVCNRNFARKMAERVKQMAKDKRK